MLIYIPPGTGHRGLDVFVNVLTIPGFKPHNEYYLDRDIRDTTAGTRLATRTCSKPRTTPGSRICCEEMPGRQQLLPIPRTKYTKGEGRRIAARMKHGWNTEIKNPCCIRVPSVATNSPDLFLRIARPDPG